MPKYHDCAQYSDQWDKLRLGIPTSSQFDKIITPTGKESAQWRKYAYGLIAERLTKRRLDAYVSPFMERGLDLEMDAMNEYELQSDVETVPIGFVTNDAGTIGCSPDRLVGENGLLELKCPAPQTQVGYLLGEELERDYYPQLQGQLFVSEREWVDILAFHPEIRFVVKRMYRDEAYIKQMAILLERVTGFIEESMTQIIGGKIGKA